MQGRILFLWPDFGILQVFRVSSGYMHIYFMVTEKNSILFLLHVIIWIGKWLCPFP